MKISVVIPHLIGVGAEAHLDRCIKSLVGYDELIVLANEGMGYGPAVNKGMALATGDHIVVVNNDTWIKYGTLKDMAVNNVVTVPDITPAPRDENPRCFFCIPRFIYEDVIERDGFFYDPQFEVGYFEDDDLIRRLKIMDVNIRTIDTVQVEHEGGGGFSMKQVGEQKFYDINHEKFLLKWSNEDNL